MNQPQSPQATDVDAGTKTAEERDAQARPGADRPPTFEEEQAADAAAEHVDPEAGEHFAEMAEIGANVRGEGEIEPRP